MVQICSGCFNHRAAEPILCLHCTHLHARNERILLFPVRMTLDSSVTVHFSTVYHRWGWLRCILRDMYICVGGDNGMLRVSLKVFICLCLCIVTVLFGKGRTTDDDSVPCRV